MTQAANHRPRLAWLDFAKGIGILLVVWAHAKGPLALYIYQFHMPLFFLISGYLYNGNDRLGTFVKKRIYGLYLPFVFWNVLFFLIRYFTQYVPISRKTTLEFIWLTLLTVEKNSRVFGASWFLGALFTVTIVYKLLDVLLRKVPGRRFLLTILFCACGAASFVYPLPFTLNRTVILSLFYAVGVLVKELLEALNASYETASGLRLFARRIHAPAILAAVSFVSFFILNRNNTANMGANRYTSPVMFVLGSFLMSYALLYLCAVLQNRGFKLPLLTLLGRRSIDLLLWQFFFFRVVTIAELVRWNLPLSRLLEQYPTYYTGKIWWILYFLAGTFLPLLWGSFLRSGPWGKVLKKIHVV